MAPPPLQPLLGSVPFSNGSVLGALSETKFVVIDYGLGLFILYEISAGAVVQIDSVAHSYPATPNQTGALGEIAPYAARFAETAVPVSGKKEILYVGYYDAEPNAYWSKISLMANPDVPIWIDVATGDFAQTIPDEDVGYIGEANDGNPQAQYVSCEGIAAVGLSYTAASTQVYGIAPITFSVQPPNMRVEFGGP